MTLESVEIVTRILAELAIILSGGWVVIHRYPHA